MAFGRFGHFPFTFGGGTSYVEQEYEALRSALAPNRQGYNVDDDLLDIEIFAHAVALAQIWAANKRSQNQALPLRMLEELRRWEEIIKLRPAPTDSDQGRRAAVAAKLRGLSGNALTDIEATARAVLGGNYEAVRTVASGDVVAYWPGVNPGPPGYEWSSNRCVVAIQMNRNGLSDSEVQAKIARLHEKLDTMLPAWMTFQIGVGSEWVVNQGIVGLTLL